MSNWELAKKIEDNVNQVFIGKEEIVRNIIICFLAGGHILLEDVPGVGKTTLALTLAKSLECSFGRIQFTPDTLPGDVAGMSVYNMKTGEFVYRPGVIMNHIILADEINRTSPKTQAGLLEAMEEEQVTVDGVIHALPQPFLVIATQYLQGQSPKKVGPVCRIEDILSMRKEVESITVKESVLNYTEDIIKATREDARLLLLGITRKREETLEEMRERVENSLELPLPLKFFEGYETVLYGEKVADTVMLQQIKKEQEMLL